MVCVDSDGRIVLVNAQAERLFGYRREDLAGQPVEILVPDAIKAGHPALRAGYADDPKPRPMGAGMELSGRRRDGSTFPAEISLSAIDTDEGILVSAAVRDVTERRSSRTRSAGATGTWNRSPTQSRTTCVPRCERWPATARPWWKTTGTASTRPAAVTLERIEAASVHMSAAYRQHLASFHVSRAEINLQPVDLGAEAASIAKELAPTAPAAASASLSSSRPG